MSTETSIQKIINERKEKIKKLNDKKLMPYPSAFNYTHKISDIRTAYEKIDSGAKTGLIVKICGRIISRREMGRATFCHIRDSTGEIQIYLRENMLGKDSYDDFLSLIDIGDHIGIEGEVFKTRTGELSIDAKEWVILSKSLRPLPEKWHGLKDIETRYRQRYLDLISNPSVKERFFIRSSVITLIKNFFNERGFLEVETPILQVTPGGALARPFKTYHNALDMGLYLRIAPELYLKMLIIGGFDKIYEIGKSFRNEGIDRKHNPEFTMLEVYQAYSDYFSMMRICEELIFYVTNELGLKTFRYNNYEINIELPFRRYSLDELLQKEIGVKLEELLIPEEMLKIAKELDIDTTKPEKKIFDHIFEKKIQPQLIQPTFVYDYPLKYSPLAKQKKDNKLLAERFELFIGTEEIANAYSELNDPVEQLERFQAQQKLRTLGDEEAHPIDMDYIRALEYGMPPTAGLGIGIDRLVYVLTGVDSIREVIFFPLQRQTEI